MHYIALNVLHNMNSSRIMLYREMKKYFENQNINSDDEVFELGRKLGLADHVIKYEYDGCMYANFIVPQNDVKRLSEKAKVDFKLYDSELKYKLFEMPITFDIYPEFLEAKMHRVDTIDRAYEEKLMEEKWSRNKTLQRYKKKINSFSELENTIYKLNEVLGGRDEYNKSLEELIAVYGTRRNSTKDSTAWINFRGCYWSKSLNNFWRVYSHIFDYTDKAIEWGGEPLSLQYLSELCDREEKNLKDFLVAAMEDGMIRKIGKDMFSITGHAASIHKCISSKYHLNRLSVIIRRKEKQRFILLIGENSLYSQKIKEVIYCDTKRVENYWRLFEADTLSDVITKIMDIITAFDIYEDYYYWPLIST